MPSVASETSRPPRLSEQPWPRRNRSEAMMAASLPSDQERPECLRRHPQNLSRILLHLIAISNEHNKYPVRLYAYVPEGNIDIIRVDGIRLQNHTLCDSSALHTGFCTQSSLKHILQMGQSPIRTAETHWNVAHQSEPVPFAPVVVSHLGWVRMTS